MRKKKFFIIVLLLLTVAMAVLFVSCKSDEEREESENSSSYAVLYAINDSGDGAVVTGVSKFNGNKLVIPEQTIVNGTTYPVVAIGEKALQNFDTMQVVELPETLERIEDSAFFDCDELLEIKIPDSVEYIGKDAFMKCGKLSRIKIPEGLKTIGSKCFAECTSLVSVILNDSLGAVPEGLFYNCSKLESCYVGDGVQTVGNYAFSGCASLTFLSLGSSVKQFGNGQAVIDKDVNPQLVVKSGDITFESGAFVNTNYVNAVAYDVGCFDQLLKFRNADIQYFDENGYVKFSSENFSVELTSANYSGALNLNDFQTKGSFKIKCIAESAFEGNAELEEITLPDGITEIPKTAFANCVLLNKVHMPGSVTLIDGKAFANCSSLRLFNIGSSVQSIEFDAFVGCESVCFSINNSSINFKGGENSLNYRPYVLNCERLNISEDGYVYGIEKSGYATVCDIVDNTERNVILPATIDGVEVTKTSNYCFCNNNGLENFYIPNTIAELGKNSFVSCYDLRVFVSFSSVPEKWGMEWAEDIKGYYLNCNRYIDGEEYVYSITNNNCVEIIEYKGMQSDVVIEDSVEGSNVVKICIGAFKNNALLKSVALPTGLTTIENDAFSGCINLIYIENTDVIPLTSLGSGAFNNCKSLDYFYIGSGVKEIGANAFSGCSDAVVYCQSDVAGGNWNEKWSGGSDVKYGSILTENKVICQQQSESALLLKYIGTEKELQLPSDINGIAVTAVGERAFAGNAYVESLSFPDSYTEIGDNAFEDCVNLKSVKTGVYVESVGSNAFEGCASLVNAECTLNVLVYMPLSSLVSVTLSACEEVPEGIFDKCTSLESLTVLDGLKSISANAFRGCFKLGKISLPSSVERIGKDAFAYTSYVNNVQNIENGLIYIGDCLIAAVDGVSADCTVKDGTRVIAESAFEGYYDVEKVTLPLSLEYIGKNAFHLSGLGEIVIGEKVKVIGESAFAYTPLRTTEIPLSVIEMGKGVFAGCTISNIFAEAQTQPEGWATDWIDDPNVVIFDCKNNISTPEGLRYYMDPVSGIAYHLEDDTASVTVQSEYLRGSVNIPSTITVDGAVYSVQRVEAYAFFKCKEITDVTIGEGIREICDYAFYLCKGLGSVTLPSSLETIGQSAFSGSGISSLEIPAEVQSIGERAFYNADLQNIVVSADNTVYASQDGVLYDKNVSELIYYPLSKSDKTFVVPETVTAIRSLAFSGCVNLQKVVITPQVTLIYREAFKDCDNCILYVEDGKDAVSSWESLWNYSKRPVVYNYPENDVDDEGRRIAYVDGAVYVIANGTAQLIEYLPVSGVAFDIPESVESGGETYPVDSIAAGALTGEGAELTVNIPGTLIKIADGAFDYNSITAFNVDQNNPNYKSLDGDLYTKDEKTLVKYATAKTAESYVVRDSVEQISAYAFSRAENLKSVTLTDKIKTVGTSTFEKCISLESITLPDSVVSVWDRAFAGCVSLGTVVWSDKIEKIGSYAFYKCENLQSVELPTSLTEIESYAFYGCEGLQSLTVPGNVRAIRSHAFLLCISLYNVVIEEGVETIENYAFAYSDDLTSVDIPASVTLIGDGSFSGCENLRYVSIGQFSGLTEIGKYAFYNCHSLKYVSLPDKLRTIGAYAFENCISLTEVSFGYYNNLSSIEECAFKNTGLVTFRISDRLSKMGYSVFAGCANLTVYCESASAPSGWNENWNPNGRPVEWSSDNKTETSTDVIYVFNDPIVIIPGGNTGSGAIVVDGVGSDYGMRF